MKQKILSVFLIIFMLSIMALPALANTSNWAFTMYYRVVDGSANGQFHSMTAGSMSLSGNVWAFSKDPGAVPSPYTIYISIYESVFGPDRYVGQSAVTPSDTLFEDAPVSGTYGNQNAGSYYLFIYKASDDGWNVSGSGTLTTQ